MVQSTLVITDFHLYYFSNSRHGMGEIKNRDQKGSTATAAFLIAGDAGCIMYALVGGSL